MSGQQYSIVRLILLFFFFSGKMCLECQTQTFGVSVDSTIGIIGIRCIILLQNQHIEQVSSSINKCTFRISKFNERGL